MNSEYNETVWKVGSSQICTMLVTVRGLFRLLCTEFAEAFIQLILKLITTLTVVICGKDKQIRPAGGSPQKNSVWLVMMLIIQDYVQNSNIYLCSDLQHKNTAK